MSDQPTFLDDLKRDLTTAADVMEDRRAKRRRLVTIGAGVAGIGALLIALSVGATGRADDDRDDQVEAVAEPDTAPDPDTAPELDGAPEPEPERAEAQVTPTALGPSVLDDDDNSAVIHDLRLQTGERFRLRLPAAFDGNLTMSEPNPPEAVTIDGPGGRLSISFGPCSPSDDQAAFTVCGPDPLVRMVVEPTERLTASETNQFELRSLGSGSRYGPILSSAFPEVRGCGNCQPWGPIVFPEQHVAINKTGPTTVAAVDLVGSLQTAWTVNFEEHRGSDLRLVAVTDGVLIDLVGGPIVKLNADGEEQWRLEREADEDRLDVFGRFLSTSFTGPDNNQAPLLRRIDLDTGEVQWRSNGRIGADWQASSAVIFGNTLVIVDVRDQNMTGPLAVLHGFDITSGDSVWTTELDASSQATDAGLLALFDVEDGRLLLSRTVDGTINRIDPLTGRKLWQALVPLGRFNGTEFASDGTLAIDIESPSGRTLLDPATGRIIDSDTDQNSNTDQNGGSLFACPVTVPPMAGFTPPEPWPATPTDPESIWYGSGELWTIMDRTGHQRRKNVWWSVEFPGGGVEERPELEVTFQRLDPGAGEPAAEENRITFAAPGTNAFTPEDHHFMINGIEPDGPGCWQATGTYKGASLSYVYEVD